MFRGSSGFVVIGPLKTKRDSDRHGPESTPAWSRGSALGQVTADEGDRGTRYHQGMRPPLISQRASVATMPASMAMPTMSDVPIITAPNSASPCHGAGTIARGSRAELRNEAFAFRSPRRRFSLCQPSTGCRGGADQAPTAKRRSRPNGAGPRHRRSRRRPQPGGLPRRTGAKPGSQRAAGQEGP